ncbi:MAG: hypothetical protein K9N57_00465 [Candidatus Marinimicrobia bacterium]|nr:hypothetical protein [Candidatus Neomarinimicrobiota bacterium]
MSYAKLVMEGHTLTRENFQSPPMEMGILPFWFWNGELDKKEMEWQLREYKDKGVTGLFLHGRFGLKVPYLSEGWFDRVKYVVELAKDVGVDIWVYDEMNWPSGTADRKVPQNHPELRQKYLELVPLDVYGPLFTYLEARDERYVNTGDSKPIVAYACSEEEFQNGIENLIDLTPNLSFDKIIPWEAPEGHWKLLYFLEKEVDYYIDALNPDATDKFIEYTHEQYKSAIGDDFNSIMPGFYTDEPAMHYYHVGTDNYVVPWTKKMFKIFRERCGYDLKPHLPALFLDMGEKTSQIRYDFWNTLSEQYTNTYYKRIRDWCEDNNVLFTGHVLFEDWLRASTRAEGNIFRHLEQMHITGVDHLYPKIGTEEAPAEHIALKIGSSAAHHFGSNRLLCESMGGSYWDCSLERMKWIADWEYVLGVNLFNNHGYHYSIEGERKRDWPPSQFYHHTWWKYYDKFTEYMARLGHMLSGGTHVAKVLMLYPLNSLWANYTPQKRTAVGDVIENDFYYLTDALLRLHYDFDYTDEPILKDAKVEDGKILINEEAYSVLILPPTTHITRAVFDKISDFVASGGHVIADTLLPYEFLETEQNGAVDEVKELFHTDPKEIYADFSNGAQFDVRHYRESGSVTVIHGKGMSQERKRDELDEALRNVITPDVTIDEDDVFYLHRVKDEYDLYFFANTAQEDKGEVQITFEQLAKPELWNPDTGEITPIHTFDIVDGRLAVTLEFPATESHFVLLSDELPNSHVRNTNLNVTDFDGTTVAGYMADDVDEVFAEVYSDDTTERLSAATQSQKPPIEVGPEFDFAMEDDNVLCISEWRMQPDEEGVGVERQYFAKDFDDSDWLNVTMGAWEMQLPQEREEETYPVDVWYRVPFEAEYLTENMRLLIDGFSGEDFTLYINGEEVTEEGTRSSIDAEIKEVPVYKYLQEGTNVVALRLTVSKRTHGLLDLLKIVGDFSVSEAQSIVEPKSSIEIGDWTTQGLPYYSGTGVYTTSVEISEEYTEGCRLFLEVDCGEDVLECQVNGGEPVIVPWHPYVIDVTDQISAGKNRFELKVTNTSINILEGKEHPSGLRAAVRIIPANEYRLSR